MGTTFKETVAENKNLYTKKLFETGNQLNVADFLIQLLNSLI